MDANHDLTSVLGHVDVQKFYSAINLLDPSHTVLKDKSRPAAGNVL